jgi:hypothetical protein
VEIPRTPVLARRPKRGRIAVLFGAAIATLLHVRTDSERLDWRWMAGKDKKCTCARLWPQLEPCWRVWSQPANGSIVVGSREEKPRESAGELRIEENACVIDRKYETSWGSVLAVRRENGTVTCASHGRPARVRFGSFFRYMEIVGK